MPISKEERVARAEKVFARYYGGTLALSEDEQIPDYYLKEIISAVFDSELENFQTMKCYSERIKNARLGIYPQGERLTQIEVGRIIGISGVAVHKKEQGKSPIDRNDLLAFCLLYQVTPDYLLGKVSDPYTFLKSPSPCKSVDKAKMHADGPQKEKTEKRVDNSENEETEECTDGSENEETEKRTNNSENETKVDSGSISFPLSFPHKSVHGRAQLLIYNAYNNSALYAAFQNLTTASFDVQEKVLSRFQELPVIDSCPLDEAVISVLSEEFQMKWTEFIVFKSENERLEIRQFMGQLAHLGTCNFSCLDFMARVSILPQKIKDMAEILITESLICQKYSDL